MQTILQKSFIALFAAAVLITVGCANTKNTEPTIDAAMQSESSEPLTIGVAVYPGFGAFYVAEEKKLFEQEGIDVEIVQLSPEAMIPALANNEVQLLVGSMDTMPIVADAGIDAKAIFSTSTSHGADGILVDTSIQSVKDLQGKKVHLAYGFPGHFLLRTAAEDAGLQYEDMELIDMNADNVGSAFITGAIDAGVTWEPWLSQATEREDGHVLATSADHPGVITDIVMARSDIIQERHDDVQAFMRAYFAGLEYWENYPDDGDNIVAKAFNVSAEDISAMRTVVKFSDYDHNIDIFNIKSQRNVYALAEKASEIYLKDGIISTALNDANDVIDASLLRELK